MASQMKTLCFVCQEIEATPREPDGEVCEICKRVRGLVPIPAGQTRQDQIAGAFKDRIARCRRNIKQTLAARDVHLKASHGLGADKKRNVKEALREYTHWAGQQQGVISQCEGWLQENGYLDGQKGKAPINVRQARQLLGMTQRALAEQIGVSRIYIAKVEAGERKASGKLLKWLGEVGMVGAEKAAQ